MHDRKLARTVITAATGPIIAALVAALLGSCGAPRQPKVAPATLPTPRNQSVEVQGASFVANALTDPSRAQAMFGFDIRGAGLLPVRLTVDNKSRAIVHIKPEQTFLVDKEGQAWPMLTQSQAYNRINRALEQGEIAIDQSETGQLLHKAVSTVGFAVGMLLGRDMAGQPLRCFNMGAGLGVAQEDSCYTIENELRKGLSSQGLKNERMQPGDLAYGVLFFPGKDEARFPKSLRLSLEFDGYPEVVTVPLQ